MFSNAFFEGDPDPRASPVWAGGLRARTHRTPRQGSSLFSGLDRISGFRGPDNFLALRRMKVQALKMFLLLSAFAPNPNPKPSTVNPKS